MGQKTNTIILLVALIAFSVLGAAQGYEFNIREDDCNSREASFFSLYDKSGGNIGEPGYYKWDVCGSGVEEVKIQETCDNDLNSILSMHSKNNSHASTFENYRFQVCASFPASINNSCQTENQIVSLAKKDNSHVGEPEELKYELCASTKEVESVTLEMSISGNNQIYSDGQQVSSGYYTEDSEYPYIVTDDPTGIVSYSPWESINYTTENSNDILRVTQEEGSFIVPNTVDSYTDIESREDAVSNRELLNQLYPSFAFLEPEDPTVRVIYDPQTKVEGFDRELSNNINIYARHKADDNPEPVIDLGIN